MSLGSKKKTGVDKPHINICFMGHVDSGKSTTTGHLIFKCGGVDKRTIEKFEKEATESGKGSFKYAWVTDKVASERERGITITATQTKIETENNIISIIDAPGHVDFIKNMITGAASSDVAVLVIPAKKGEFETAISKNGQALEHAKLAFTMGNKRIVLLVNKMDTEDYSEERFNEIKSNVVSSLKKVGYKADEIPVIPISGFFGDNLVEPSSHLSWFKGWSYISRIDKTVGDVKLSGVTLLDWMKLLQESARLSGIPLRIPINDVYKISGVGVVAVGRCESGILKPNDLVYICPSNITTEVKSVQMHHEDLEFASAGDSIGFNLKNVALTDLKRGNVLGHLNNNPPQEVESFVAQIVVINKVGEKDTGIRIGYSPVVDIHTSHGPVKIIEIRSRLDKRSGQPIVEDVPDAPIVIKHNDAAIVVMKPINPLCCESYSEFPPLGRFAVRDSKTTVAVGIIREVKKKDIVTSRGGAGGKGKGKGPASKVGGAKGKKK